ncbi:MAG: hypothetical protein PVI75_00150 [Gammaproteobacteria bacterium]|jgi:hypothetical protein
MKNLKIIMFLSLCFSLAISHAASLTKENYAHLWSILLYRGQTVKENLNKIIFNGKRTYVHENVYSAELSRIFYQNNFLSFQIAGNIASRIAASKYYNGSHPIFEEDIYVKLYYLAFPWNRWINTTVGVGEGISYTNELPCPEKDCYSGRNSKKLLDFMTFEITMGLPAYPQWQIVGRIHHRSGAFGVFATKKGSPGSNVLGLGIRCFFG